MPLFSNTETESSSTGTENSTTPSNPTTSINEEEILVEENLPSVELVVEDGLGIENANSYVDLDFALEYCTMKGYSNWKDLSEEEQKVFLIRGTDFVDNFFIWKGYRRYKTQSLSFPREEVFDLDGYRVDSIPINLKKACVEAAWLNAESGTDTLFTTKDENGNIKRQKVDSLEVEYFSKSESNTNKNSSVDYTSIYDILNKLLKGLYKTSDSVSKICSRVIHTGW